MKRLLLGAGAALACCGAALAQTAIAPGVTAIPGGVSVSGGTLAGTLIEWFLVPAIPALAGTVALLLLKIAKGVGIATDESLRSKLQDMIENGLKAGAHELEITLDGKLSFDTKNALIDWVVTKYLPQHAAETVAKLGGDVTDTGAMAVVVAARGAETLATPLVAPAPAAVVINNTAAPKTVMPAAR